MLSPNYQQLALRTAKLFPTTGENLFHAGIGMVTEAGEIATTLKRIYIYGKEAAPLMPNLREEIGDYVWYVALAASAVQLDLQEISLTASLDEGDIDLFKGEPVKLFMGLAASANFMVLMMSSGDEDYFNDDGKTAVGVALKAVDLLCRQFGFVLAEICAENIAKLQARYPEKYSDELAEARLDKGGLDATQS